METRKIIPITIIGLGFGFLGYQIIKSNKPNVTYSNSGTNPNVTLYGEPFNARSIAIKLKAAMVPDGWFNATDETEIIEILSGINQEQFYKVIVAFGKQRYSPGLGNEYGLYKYGLPFWIKNELDEGKSDEYKTLKKLFPKYLK